MVVVVVVAVDDVTANGLMASFMARLQKQGLRDGCQHRADV